LLAVVSESVAVRIMARSRLWTGLVGMSALQGSSIVVGMMVSVLVMGTVMGRHQNSGTPADWARRLVPI